MFSRPILQICRKGQPQTLQFLMFLRDRVSNLFFRFNISVFPDDISIYFIFVFIGRKIEPNMKGAADLRKMFFFKASISK